MKQVIVITGASSGFGALSARALARAGHTVYAGILETTGRNASRASDHGMLVGIRHNAASSSATPH